MPHDLTIRCPACHSLMEEGYLPTCGGMHWFRRRDASSVDFAEALPGTFTWLRRARLEAWRCKKCQLVTFRYGQSHDPNPEAAVAEATPAEQDAP